jgi:hypothetical protein
VSLPSGQGETSESSVNVKIGQTLDKVRGQVKDPIEGGKILTPSERRTSKP